MDELRSILTAKRRVSRGLQSLRQMRNQHRLLSMHTRRRPRSHPQTDYGSVHPRPLQSQSAVLLPRRRRSSRTQNSSEHTRMPQSQYTPRITPHISILPQILRKSCDHRQRRSSELLLQSSQCAPVSLASQSQPRLDSSCSKRL